MENGSGKTIAISFSTFGSNTVGGEGLALDLALPGLTLPAGWSLGSLTVGIQTEDQFSGVRMWLEQLYDLGPSVAAGELAHHSHLEHLVGAHSAA